jgi:hypothetical protein
MGMTKIYAHPGMFRKLPVFAVFFTMIKGYDFSQYRFKFFEPPLYPLPYHPGVHALKQIHLYKPALVLYRDQYRQFMGFANYQVSLPVPAYFTGVYFRRTAVYTGHFRYFPSPLYLFSPFPPKPQFFQSLLFYFPFQVKKM